METDYKSEDRARILSYLSGRAGKRVSVRELKESSGANPLRVYPLLFELEEEGAVEVVEREEMGAPEWVAGGEVSEEFGRSRRND